MPLVDRVRQTIRRHGLAAPGTRIVAALSGGPDSVALVHLLHTLDHAGELRLVGLAHLNHQLRDEADGDERFCRTFAAALALPLHAERVDVRSLARAGRRSIEDAAHHARYEFFERVRRSGEADLVALGHTMDDQAETFLLRLTRGAGSRGLGGMFPRVGTVIRPLLDCRRRELREWLIGQSIAYLLDESNDDPSIPRNRVRAELLPLLAHRFNPRIVEILARETELARADEAYLSRLAADWLDAHVQPKVPGSWAIDVAELSALPAALARRVLHNAMRRAAAGRLIDFDHVEQAWAVVAGARGGVDVAGHRVERVGGSVVLRTRPPGSVGRAAGRAEPEVPVFRYLLAVPGETLVPELGCRITAEVMPAGSDREAAPDSSVAVLPLVLVQGAGLAVRTRRPGDRLRPSRAGHRKLQDVLVDRKVPRLERDRIPIVVTAEDRIVWVAGHTIDQDFRVTDPTQAVVILRLKGVGGSC